MKQAARKPDRSKLFKPARLFRTELLRWPQNRPDRLDNIVQMPQSNLDNIVQIALTAQPSLGDKSYNALIKNVFSMHFVVHILSSRRKWAHARLTR